MAPRWRKDSRVTQFSGAFSKIKQLIVRQNVVFKGFYKNKMTMSKIYLQEVALALLVLKSIIK
jgi:hypothetical protein